MMHEIWWSLPLTLIVFFLARKLAARFKFPLLNPLLVAMVVIIPFLLLTGISYERYFAGSKVLNDLLQPAVLAEVARQKAWPLTLRIQPGYDHSYYFIASFIEDHLRFHAQHLFG